MDRLDNIDLIEQYLEGTLSQTELAAVEARLATDSAFRAELELHRQIHTEFADPRKLQLRDMLSDIMQQEPAPQESARTNWLKMLGIGLIALIGIWGIWWILSAKPDPTPAMPVPGVQQVSPQQDSSQPDTIEKASDKRQEAPIAMADNASFKRNPVFEARLGNGGIRSTEKELVQMQSPGSGANFKSKKGQVKLSFKGTILADEELEANPLQLNIYNNQSSDTPVSQITPVITNRNQQVERWTFSAATTLKLPPGLYYFTLEQSPDAALVYVGKFTVDNSEMKGK